MKRLLIMSLMATASPMIAQEVAECDWRASAWNIVEPWDKNSRTFADGAVRLAALDTIEPAAGFAHLLVLSPPYTELGDRQCRVISWSGTMGWAGMDFDALTADYDPARGLLFDIPVRIYDPETSFSNSAILSVTLNQATGDIGAEMELGRE